jgi:hypothetical protein
LITGNGVEHVDLAGAIVEAASRKIGCVDAAGRREWNDQQSDLLVAHPAGRVLVDHPARIDSKRRPLEDAAGIAHSEG